MLVEERVSSSAAMMQLVYQSPDGSVFQSPRKCNFKDEMLAFKTRYSFKNEMNQIRRFGEKMGTFVEDIVLPGPPLLLKKSFNGVDDMSIPKGFRSGFPPNTARRRLRRYRWRCVSLTLCSWTIDFRKPHRRVDSPPTRLFVINRDLRSGPVINFKAFKGSLYP